MEQTWKNRIKLFCGVIVLYVITQVLLPYAILNSDNDIIQFIQEEQIDTTPLFYTESEKGVNAIIK